MTAVKPESASHWYDLDGQPCHEVPRAKGDGMRPTTLADARKLHLLPSVTNVPIRPPATICAIWPSRGGRNGSGIWAWEG